MDLDLRVMPRDHEASIRIALREVQCTTLQRSRQATHHYVGTTPFDLEWLGAEEFSTLITDPDKDPKQYRKQPYSFPPALCSLHFASSDIS
jgi:hypothetical protein